jgi:hypothetical protein
MQPYVLTDVNGKPYLRAQKSRKALYDISARTCSKQRLDRPHGRSHADRRPDRRLLRDFNVGNALRLRRRVPHASSSASASASDSTDRSVTAWTQPLAVRASSAGMARPAEGVWN